MKIRPLIITESVKADVARVKLHAERNITTLDEMTKIMKTGFAVGEDPQYRLMIPVGYRVVYSQEEQPKLGLSHHISISVSEEGKYPNEIAVKEICGLFGVKWPPHAIWIDHENQAVNVVDKL